MADTTYRISLVDDVSSAAKRVAGALENVADATKITALAVAQGDAGFIKAAKAAEKLEINQLKIERANLRVAKSVLAAAQAVDKLGASESKAASISSETAFKIGALGGIFEGLTEKVIDLGVELAGRLVDGLIDTGKYLFHVADEASRAEMSLKNMFGSVAKGNAVLDDAIGLSRRFGLNLSETLERVQQFAGLGFGQQKIKAMFELGADFAALGRSKEQISRIFADLEHMQASGFLDGRVVRSLAMNGVSVSGVYLRIAHNLHLVGTEQQKIAQVADLVHKKQVRADQAMNAVAEAMLIRGHKTELGQLGEEAADETLSGLVGKMRSGLEADIFEAVRNAQPALVEGFQSIFDGLSSIDDGGLQNTLLDALFAISDFLDKVGPKLPTIADNFVTAFSAAAGIDGINLDNLAEQLPAIATQLGTIAGNLAKIVELAAKMGAGALSGNDYTGSPISLGKAMGAEKGSLLERFADQPLTEFIGQSVSDLGKDAAAAAAGQNIGAGLAQGIADSAPSVGNAAADAAQGAIDATKDKLQIHSPSAVMADQGAMLSAGLALGIDEHADTVFSSASALAQGAIDASGGKLTDSGAGREAGAVGASAGLSAMTAIANRPAIHVDAPIHVDGARDPLAVAASVKDMFETELANIFERHLEGVGA